MKNNNKNVNEIINEAQGTDDKTITYDVKKNDNLSFSNDVKVDDNINLSTNDDINSNNLSKQKLKKNELLRKKNTKIDYFLMVIITLGWLYVCYAITQIYVLKEIHRITIIIALTTINFFFIFLSKTRIKLLERRLLKFILVVLVTFESIQGLQYSQLLKNVESVVKTEVQSSLFISLKDMNIKEFKSIDEINNFKIGYNKDVNNFFKNKFPLDNLQNTKTVNTLIPYDNDVALFTSLFEKQIDLIIFDQNYQVFMSTNDIFKTRINDVKVNHTIVSSKSNTTEAIKITEPFAIVFAGIDKEVPGILSGRNDAVIVATFNPDYSSITLTTLQRDLYIKQPCFSDNYDKFGHAFYNGDAYSYPGGGPQCLIDTVSEFLEIPIDRYIAINFKGFVDVIDAIGGLELTLDPAIYPDGLKEQDSDRKPNAVYIPNGTNVLNGEQVLAFSRNRYGLDGGSNTRASNQMYVMEELIKKLGTSDIAMINTIVSIGGANSKTSISSQDIVPFAEYGFKLFKSGATITTSSLLSNSATKNEMSVEIVDQSSLEALKHILNVNMGLEDPPLANQIKYSAFQNSKTFKYCQVDYTQEGCSYDLTKSIGNSLEDLTTLIQSYGLDINNIVPIYVDENEFEPNTVLRTKNDVFYANYANIVYIER